MPPPAPGSVSRRGSTEPKFRKAKVDKGDVVATVTATGTLSAVTTVSVGSQVSGIIAKLYVDFNSVVKKGQLLAELDPTPFQQAVDQSAREPRQGEGAAPQRRDRADAREEAVRGAAHRAVGPRRRADDARLGRRGRRAGHRALRQAETNLSYTRIVSPIDGVVVSRSYDVGQTVAASFQAPTLFMIAQDLTKMQVLTNIDEADVGRIKVGQEASFSVDAFPDAPFKGAVSQIRLSPQTVQNVVTYPVMLDVANPDLKLRPGMTANVQVPVDVRKDALRVPNAALRFRPDTSDLVAEARDKAKDAGKGGRRRPRPPPERPRPGAGPQRARPRRRPADRRPRTGRPRRSGRAGGGGRGGRPGGGAAEGRRPRASRHALRGGPDGSGKLKPVTVRTLITDGNLTAIRLGRAQGRRRDHRGPRDGEGGRSQRRAGRRPGGGGRRPF